MVAAELADRYITSRFLPDKAIDLVDEACSNLQVGWFQVVTDCSGKGVEGPALGKRERWSVVR